MNLTGINIVEFSKNLEKSDFLKNEIRKNPTSRENRMFDVFSSEKDPFDDTRFSLQ